MGLGHARGVLDLHRGISILFGGDCKDDCRHCSMRFARDGRRQWTEQDPFDTRDFLLGSFFT